MRLVVKGFSQVAGVDCSETYAPFTKMAISRLLMALAVVMKMDLHHLDLTTPFLNPSLDDNEVIYMEVPAA